MKKKIVVILALLLALGFVAASCAPTPVVEAPVMEEKPVEEEPAPVEAVGEVYFLNFKPEVAEIYEQIAVAYKAETGNTLKVVTAAAGTYEQTLRSEVAKADPPVLFQINGPRGYENWKDYTAELSDTELYKHLTDKSLAVTSGGGVYGIPFVVEGYGIIYNEAIMEKYFATAGALAASMADINNFATLKAVVEDMTAKKSGTGHPGCLLIDVAAPG
jgi:raffinose/stachyose/melibiose transport system substrate-binding protein